MSCRGRPRNRGEDRARQTTSRTAMMIAAASRLAKEFAEARERGEHGR